MFDHDLVKDRTYRSLIGKYPCIMSLYEIHSNATYYQM